MFKMRIKGNKFYIYCNEITDLVLNKVNELLKVNDKVQVEVIVN